MNLQMKYKERRWYLRGIYETYEQAINQAKKIRKRTGARYKIQQRNMLRGFEVWVTTKGR